MQAYLLHPKIPLKILRELNFSPVPLKKGAEPSSLAQEWMPIPRQKDLGVSAKYGVGGVDPCAYLAQCTVQI
jgi:hypothetical protein